MVEVLLLLTRQNSSRINDIKAGIIDSHISEHHSFLSLFKISQKVVIFVCFLLRIINRWDLGPFLPTGEQEGRS
jgi:hypothetical protein